MFSLETFENGKWSPVFNSNQKDRLEGVKVKMESSGATCRIV